MAAVRMVKCKYCGKQFNRNAEPCIEVSSRRYAHKSCAEQYLNSISKDEKEIMELYKESDKQRLINESSTGYEINTTQFMKVDEFNMSGLTGAIQIC